MNNILTVKSLNKSYGDFSLRDVTFSLPKGCVTGFIGVNGAGKTTTLRTLLGLTGKLSGSIRFFGLDMDGNERRIKDRTGIVLDDGGFYEELPLSEMKGIIASAYTSWSEQDFKRYLDMIAISVFIGVYLPIQYKYLCGGYYSFSHVFAGAYAGEPCRSELTRGAAARCALWRGCSVGPCGFGCVGLVIYHDLRESGFGIKDGHSCASYPSRRGI